MFSDAIVMASPVDPAVGEEAAIAGLLMQASWLQLSLAERGFFARGSIVVGEFYLRDEISFGAALVEAYHLERDKAIHPRVILSEEVHATQRQNLEDYVKRRGTPLTTLPLRDRDGQAFLSYLELMLEEATDPRPRLASHRDALVDKLKAYRDNGRVWEKYRWVSEYHNYFCNEHKDEDWFAPDLLIPGTDLAQELHPVI
jgi:hypothetical protein